MAVEPIVVVDLGGTQLRAALCAPDGTILKRVRKKTQASRGPEGVMARVLRAVEGVWPKEGRVQAISMVAPGPLDPFEGVVIGAPNLPGWGHVPVRDILARFGVPVYVNNDANLAALGEHRYGAGRGFDDLIYITISTGIGGGIILDGRLFVGSKGLAGEIGHIVVQPGGALCGCGNRGCLEAMASGTAIGRQARTLAASGRAPAILAAAGGDVRQVTARSVSVAAAQGDKVARKLFRQAGRYIGIAVANLMHLFNPQRFVLGGGVAQAGELLFKPIRRTACRWVLVPEFCAGVDIVPAELGDDAGLMGALAFALDKGRTEGRGT